MNRFKALKAATALKASKASYIYDPSDTKLAFDYDNCTITAEFTPEDKLLITDEFPVSYEDDVDTKSLHALAFLLNDDTVLFDYKVAADGEMVIFELENDGTKNVRVARAVTDQITEMVEDITITEANIGPSDTPSMRAILANLATARKELLSALIIIKSVLR